MNRRALSDEISRLSAEAATLRQACELVAVGVDNAAQIARRALDGVHGQWDRVLADELNALRLAATDHQQRLTAAHSQIDQLTRDLTLSRHDVDIVRHQLASDHHAAQERYDQLAADAATTRQHCDELDTLVHRLRDELDITVAERDRLLSDVATMRQRGHDLERQLTDSETERALHIEELERQRERVAELSHDNQQLSAALTATIDATADLRRRAHTVVEQADDTVELISHLAAALAATRHLFSHDHDTRNQILRDGGQVLDAARRWLEAIADSEPFLDPDGSDTESDLPPAAVTDHRDDIADDDHSGGDRDTGDGELVDAGEPESTGGEDLDDDRDDAEMAVSR